VLLAGSNRSSSKEISIATTPGLLRLWVTLITKGDSVSVHDQLSKALIEVLRKDGSSHRAEAEETMTYLVEDWKNLLSSSSSSSSGFKIAAVRCATVLVRWLSRLPEWGIAVAKESGATGLFLEMLRNFDDPLQQLTLLDALTEGFDKHGEGDTEAVAVAAVTPAVTEEWLSSPEIMSLVLQFLEDPLLSDAALRYVGVLSSIKPNELTIVLDHVRSVSGEGVPTRDTERLPLVRAVSVAAVSSEAALEVILSDPVLRRSWWDTEGIAQPKLKAAILVSVARALPEIAESLGSPRALRLYRIFGSDHGSDSSTTSWLLEGPSRSPLNEVRVASYALLAAALRIPGAAIALVGPADVASHRSLLSVLLGPDREPTANAQRARFDLLGAFWEVHQAMSLEDDPKTLKSLRAKIALGPHGRPAQRHGADDVAIA